MPELAAEAEQALVDAINAAPSRVEAARALGMSEQNLHALVRKWGIRERLRDPQKAIDSP